MTKLSLLVAGQDAKREEEIERYECHKGKNQKKKLGNKKKEKKRKSEWKSLRNEWKNRNKEKWLKFTLKKIKSKRQWKKDKES